MGTVKKSDVFHGLQFTVDFAASSKLSFNEKQEIRRDIVDNGGILSYILTKQTSYLVTCNGERTLSSYKGRTAIKNGTAVVSFEFVKECIKSDRLLDPQPYLLSETRESQNFSSGKISGKSCLASKKETNIVRKPQLPDINKIRVWLYKSADCPCFNEQSCEITKDVLLQGLDSSGNVATFYALELHMIPPQVPCSGSRYRLFTHHGNLKSLREGDQGSKECRYFSTAGEAIGGYTALYNQLTQPPFSLTRVDSILSHKIGSDKMMQMTVSDFCSEEDSQLSSDVANLVDFIWNEATGSLSNILAVPVDAIKLEDVEKAEAILLILKKALDAAEDSSTVKNLSDEFFSVIPHKDKGIGIVSKQAIAQKQDLCQLIKDMVSVGESTNWMTRRTVYAKFRSLKCHIECLEHGSDEFKKIQENIHLSETSPSKINVLNVFSIHRPVEEGTFSHDIENKKLLFHSSKVTNFVGILSRGLLLPKIVVDDFGGKRSDAGMLGSGIYFASSASTSARYSAPGSSGTRLMLINEVALGKVKVFKKFSLDLTSTPAGFDSCHGVQCTDDEPSDFKDDEFVIYNANQQKIRYLVEFVLPGDNILPRDDVSLDSGFSDEDIEVVTEGSAVELSDVMSVVDPLTKVEPGLKGTGEKPIPLQSVHIRAKLLDLAAQVIVFQAYKNTSPTPIEAKYVFPLDDMAAVCGFEAFINGKHIVGEVKEKEQAHKEYREAISQGHGAYLMDEETPDVFTVSVGNLPPGAHVLIKITYVSELMVDREHICFTLPGSVAPWKRNKALEEITQTDVDTVRIEEEGPSDLTDFSVQVSVEMPFDIRSIDSPSHAIRTKRTATKAVVLLEPGQSLGSGFQLLIGLAEIHVPRMWVERHASKPDSQACMLTFYPEFEAESPQQVEILFLLDLSCSMKGSSIDEAKKILLMCLSHMKKDWMFNILVFGSKHSELFPCSKRLDNETPKEAEEFIKSLTATKGSTELWRVLQKLYLLPAVSAADHPRNLFLISDGHVAEEDTTLHLIRTNCQTDRLFTFGVGSTANRYLLRAMSKVGAGASEFFDSKAKSKWERKVKWQLSKAEQPGLTSVAVTWQQHDSGSSSPVQAPHQILSLFNGSRQVVYGFVDNCTQATLTAEVNGKTVSTVVSTADLNITTGNILHQLTARAIIRDWDEGSLHEQRTAHEIVKRDRKDYIISISKEFSVVSKFTSFVAVEHRKKDEKFEEGHGPSINDLVALEEVDILGYIGWEQKPETRKKRELSTEDKLEKKLEEAKVLETCAVLQCERLYHDVMKEARDELGPDHALTVKTVFALSNLYHSLMGDREKAHQILEDNNLGDLSNVVSSLKSDEWGSGSDAEYDMDECMEGVGETTSTEDSTSSEEDEGWDKEVEAVRMLFSRYRRGYVGSLIEEEEKPQEQQQRQQLKEEVERERITTEPESDFTAEHMLEMIFKKKKKKKTMKIESQSISLDESFGDVTELCEPPEIPMLADQSAFVSFDTDSYGDFEGDHTPKEYNCYAALSECLPGDPVSPQYSTSSITGELSVDVEQQQSNLSGVDEVICLEGTSTEQESETELMDYDDEIRSSPLLSDVNVESKLLEADLSHFGLRYTAPPGGERTSVFQGKPRSKSFMETSADTFAAGTVGSPFKLKSSFTESIQESQTTLEETEPFVEAAGPAPPGFGSVSGTIGGALPFPPPPPPLSESSALASPPVVGDAAPFIKAAAEEMKTNVFKSSQKATEAARPAFGSYSSVINSVPPGGFSFGSSSTAIRPLSYGGFSFGQSVQTASTGVPFGQPKLTQGFGAMANQPPQVAVNTGLLGSAHSSSKKGDLFGSSLPAFPPPPPPVQSATLFGQPTLTQGFGAMANQPPQVAANTGLFGSAHSLSKKGDLFDSSLPPAFPSPPPPVQSATLQATGFSGTHFGSTVMPQSVSTGVSGIGFDKPPQPGLWGTVRSSSVNKEVSGVSPLPAPPPPPLPAQSVEVAPPTIVKGAAPVFKGGGGGEIKTHVLKSIPPAPAKKVPFFGQLKARLAERIETFSKKGEPHVSEKYETPSSSLPSVTKKKIEYLGAASSEHKDTRTSSVPLQPMAFRRARRGAPSRPPADTRIPPPLSSPADTPVVDDSEPIRHLHDRRSIYHRRGASSFDAIPTLEQKKGAEKITKPNPFFSVSSKTQKLKEIFAKQTSVGFWNADDLIVIGITKKDFVDFLVKAGAKSLGPRVFEEVQSLLATLLMLAFVKFRLSVEVPLTLPLGNIFEVSVGDLGEPYSKDVTRALEWIKMQERKIPLLYARLEFGANWEAATEKIVEEMRV